MDGDIVIADTAEDQTAGRCVELFDVGSRRVLAGLHTIAIRSTIKFGAGYLGYYLSSPAYRKQLIPQMQGTKVISISKTSLKNTSIASPQPVEQIAIGALLRKLDALIAAEKRKLRLIKMKKRALLQCVLYKKMRFAGFHEPWSHLKLGDAVRIYSGKDYKHLPKGDIPVYGTGGYMTSVSKSLSDQDAIGIGRKGTIDKPYILHAPFWTVDTLFYALPKRGYDLSFMFAIFQNINWKSIDESTGLPSLSKKNINSVGVNMPETEEQRKVGKLFSLLDLIENSCAEKIDLLNKKKKYLLLNMFV